MIQLPIEIGDIIRVGRFKNKRITVKEISVDENGLPTVNGRGILKIRIEKLMPIKKEIKENAMKDDLNEIFSLSTDGKMLVDKLKNDLNLGFIYLNQNIITFNSKNVRYSEVEKVNNKLIEYGFKTEIINVPYSQANKSWASDPMGLAIKIYNDFHKVNIKENSMVNEGPEQNNPKIQKIVDELNKLIASAKDSDGDPIGVVDTSSSWQEPYVYQPIQYKNGSLKIVSQSQYKNKPEVEIISKKDMEFEGIPTLKNILKMYRKAMKESGKSTNEGSMKRNIKEFRDKGTKVTVKKEDNEFWLYQLGEDGEECISNIGYKTEELANHAAFMKGFEVVNSKGTKEKIGFDELPDTRLPPKGTKAEPVKHDEPKTMDLGSEKKINLESLIRRIIKEEKLRISRQKKRINEADVTNTGLEAKAKRYAEIANKMKLLEEELENLESEFTSLDEEFRTLLEQIGTTKGTFIRAGEVLVKIEREGYDKKSKSYKTGFAYLYNKVNATMKDLANEALKMTETVSYVKSKISVVEEGRLNENWFSKIKSFLANKIKKIFGLNNQANKELDELESKIG